MPCRLLSPFALSTLVVTCCVPLGAASSARAQAPGTDPASSPPRGALIVAGGTDAIVRDGDQWTPSAALHLGYELPARRGGLTWRAGVDLWSQGHGDRTVFANGTPVETLDRSGRSWAYGASLYGSWGPSVEVTRIRPYLLGGAGVHRFTTVQRVSPGAGSRTSFTADIDAARTSLSVTGGAGLQADVGRVTMFTEVRYMRLLGTEVGRSGSPLVRNWLMPLTVGVRLP